MVQGYSQSCWAGAWSDVRSTLSRCKGTHVVRVPFEFQVPALTYGGPQTAPDEPSTESAKVSESLVILEFIADLFPERGLMPADAVGRARVRSFITFFETTFIRDNWDPVFHKGESPAKLVDALEALQSRLPETGYAVGTWSIADAAAAPFLALLPMLLEHEIGKYPLGQGTLALAAINDPRLSRVRKYIADLKNRASFRKVWDEVSGTAPRR